MKSFSSSSTPDGRILLENYGLTVYKAQMLEDCLRIILVAAELQDRVEFDRTTDLRLKAGDDDLLLACLGPMIKVLKANNKSGDTDSFTKMLSEANQARNLLVHRFFVENGTDLLNAAGRLSLNDQMERIFIKIVQALLVSEGLRDKLFQEWGISKAEMQRRADDLRRQFGADI